jgi:hypothetical protein
VRENATAHGHYDYAPFVLKGKVKVKVKVKKEND